MSQPQQSNATPHNPCNKQSNATIIIDLCPFGLHIKHLPSALGSLEPRPWLLLLVKKATTV